MSPIDDQIAAAEARFNAMKAENDRLRADVARLQAQLSDETPGPESLAALARMATAASPAPDQAP